MSGLQSLQIWIRRTITKLEKYHKLQLEPKTTDELQVALGRAAARTHQQCGDEIHQALDCLHGCGYRWWSLWVSAVTVSVSMSACLSHHQQTGSFHSHQQTSGEDNAGNAEKWGFVLAETAEFCHFKIHFTKRGGKVCTFLLNSNVQIFHTKICMHCWNIKRSHRGGGCFFMFTL